MLIWVMIMMNIAIGILVLLLIKFSKGLKLLMRELMILKRPVLNMKRKMLPYI